MKLLNVKQVSVYLKLHINTVWNLCKNGKIPSCKVGGRYRIPMEYLESLFETSGDSIAEGIKLAEKKKKNKIGLKIKNKIRDRVEQIRESHGKISEQI